jgi:hypothetical protein
MSTLSQKSAAPRTSRRIMFSVIEVRPAVRVMRSPNPPAAPRGIQVRMRRTDNVLEPQAAQGCERPQSDGLVSGA